MARTRRRRLSFEFLNVRPPFSSTATALRYEDWVRSVKESASGVVIGAVEER